MVLGTRLVLAAHHEAQDLVGFTIAHGRGLVLAADKTGNPGDGLDEMPGIVIHGHLDHDVARVELAGGGLFLALDQLDDLFRRHNDLFDAATILAGAHHLLDGLLHPQLEARVGMQNVPSGRSTLVANVTLFNHD